MINSMHYFNKLHEAWIWESATIWTDRVTDINSIFPHQLIRCIYASHMAYFEYIHRMKNGINHHNQEFLSLHFTHYIWVIT